MKNKGEDAPRAMGQLTADNPTKAGPTIVGGQPPRQGRSLKGVPVGIERVLFLAAMEPDFRQALLADGADRQAVVEDRGLTMRASELAMLRFIPSSQLEANIAGVDTSEENVERRTFMRAVAAGALAVTSAEAFSGCDDAVDGSRPIDRGPSYDSTGIRPDWYGPAADAGARMDIPPPDAPRFHPDMGSRPNPQDASPPLPEQPAYLGDGAPPQDQSTVEVSVPSLDSTGIRPGKDGS